MTQYCDKLYVRLVFSTSFPQSVSVYLVTFEGSVVDGRQKESVCSGDAFPYTHTYSLRALCNLEQASFHALSAIIACGNRRVCVCVPLSVCSSIVRRTATARASSDRTRTVCTRCFQLSA